MMLACRLWIGAVLVGGVLAAPLGLATQTEKINTHSLKQADLAFREGFAARQSGNLELARTKFAEVARLEPKIPEGHEALGAVLLEMGRAGDAIAELESAAELEPNDSGNQANLAVAYAQTGATAKAIPHFEMALQLADKPSQTPMNAMFYEAYGRALAATGKPNAALRQFKAAEALPGRHADIEDAIGSLYAQQGQWDQARSRFLQAIALDGSLVLARVHWGLFSASRTTLPTRWSRWRLLQNSTHVLPKRCWNMAAR